MKGALIGLKINILGCLHLSRQLFGSRFVVFCSVELV